MAEIKAKLPYKVNAQMLASKQHLCINEEVWSRTGEQTMGAHKLNHKCSKLRQSRRLDEPAVEFLN